MSLATVTDLPLAGQRRPLSVTRLVPNLTRQAREDGLNRLARAWAEGIPLHETDTAVLVCMYASPAVDDQRALVMFGALVGEWRRASEFEASGEYPEMPGHYEQDLRRVLDDLLDGTESYGGNLR